jgi:hypothetical protein
MISTTKSVGLPVGTVLLIICSNRPEYLDRSLEHVIRHHPKFVLPYTIRSLSNRTSASTGPYFLLY